MKRPGSALETVDYPPWRRPVFEAFSVRFSSPERQILSSHIEPMKEFFQKAITYVRKELWEPRTRDLPLGKRLVMKNLKIIIQSVKSYVKVQGMVRASALTLFTLLSIVPVIAMLFGIAKGFGVERRMEAQLRSQFPEQQQLLDKVFEFARSWLENTQGGLVAGVGVIILLYTVVRLIANIEVTFNHMWGINKDRPWSRKFSDYLSLMLIGPFLGIASSSMSVFVVSQVSKYTEETLIYGAVDTLVSWALNLGPYVIIWFLFSFTFIFLPNTKVKLVSGIYAGIIAGTLYQIVQFAYINLQIGVSKLSAIYGSFAALPLFLIWLQISWNIVLFGSQLSYTHQNFDATEKADTTPRLSFRTLKTIALSTVKVVVTRFIRGESAPTVEQVATAAGLPMRIARESLGKLVEAGVLVEVTLSEDDSGFHPARDPADVKVAEVLRSLEEFGEGVESVTEDGNLSPFAERLAAFDEATAQHPQNLTLKEL